MKLIDDLELHALKQIYFMNELERSLSEETEKSVFPVKYDLRHA